MLRNRLRVKDKMLTASVDGGAMMKTMVIGLHTAVSGICSMHIAMVCPEVPSNGNAQEQGGDAMSAFGVSKELNIIKHADMFVCCKSTIRKQQAAISVHASDMKLLN